ncbi:Phosphate acetyltransferase [Halomicronema hongdechloris C2206]|uniref:Phosphate acetyltransferase n=1 Tax=Halomicronema hongdechloris C2206 TaxID=1641165 RepID=A0A1Z3HHG9_9CYAN|nr:phosphotransacetylase family protein [Halomicronema hongdechloris]ASC69720.1 Phosphate acetyltransferase [Halomicronema hongdechloris C2206]
MPKPVNVLIGSIEAYSGKSATVLGIALQLQQQGIDIAYGKPIGTCLGNGSSATADKDVEFIARTLDLPESRLRFPLFNLDDDTIAAQLAGENSFNYCQRLATAYARQGEEAVVLLEGPGTLDEGALFQLSLPHMARAIEATVILVARFHSLLVVDALLAAKERLGTHLAGVIINDIPEEHLESVNQRLRPCLERHQIPVLATLPRTPLMRSISVREMVQQLQAEVLCCEDRLELMVESLAIGAMNVNSALRYFRKRINMAVVTGGDRTDIQLAALETSTHCLVLTGHMSPSEAILARAKDLEIPILSVDFDTLTTVEQIDQLFGQVRLHEPAKVTCVQELMQHHLDAHRLMDILNLPMAASLS